MAGKLQCSLTQFFLQTDLFWSSLTEIIPMRCYKGAGFVSILNEVFKLEGGCVLFIATSTAWEGRRGEQSFRASSFVGKCSGPNTESSLVCFGKLALFSSKGTVVLVFLNTRRCMRICWQALRQGSQPWLRSLFVGCMFCALKLLALFLSVSHMN